MIDATIQEPRSDKQPAHDKQTQQCLSQYRISYHTSVVITRFWIAFGDLLASSMALQVLTPCIIQQASYYAFNCVTINAMIYNKS